MPAEHIEVHDRMASDFTAAGSTATLSKTGVRAGQLVRHPSFGMGRVTDVQEGGQHTRVVVEFSRFGKKTLIWEYANLDVLV